MVTAYSAIEQAMCDIAAQALGVPLHEMLGGLLRSTVPVYANINRAANRRTPEDFAEKAQQAASEGFRAVKAAVFDDFPTASADQAEREAKVDLGVLRLEAMRKAVGPSIDIMVDCHSRFDRALSIAVAKRLEPVNLRWYEEPVNPEDLVDTRAIRDSIKQPMAGGEILFGREGFLPLLQSQAVDVIMPDVKHCGGIFEGKKIAALAETYGVGFSPHNPSGPVSMAASAQLAATVPNCPVLEHAWGEVDWRAELLDPPERFENGAIVLSGNPGIGHKLVQRSR
jgi:galactonate dehydratase